MFLFAAAVIGVCYTAHFLIDIIVQCQTDILLGIAQYVGKHLISSAPQRPGVGEFLLGNGESPGSGIVLDGRVLHQKITKKAISDTSGLAMRTVHKPYIQQYLLKYPEFNPNIEITDSDNTVREQKLEIARLKKLLAKSKNQNNRLTKELLTLKEKHKELEYNYECLLGDYQKAGEKKVIRL